MLVFLWVSLFSFSTMAIFFASALPLFPDTSLPVYSLGSFQGPLPPATLREGWAVSLTSELSETTLVAVLGVNKGFMAWDYELPQSRIHPDSLECLLSLSAACNNSL